MKPTLPGIIPFMDQNATLSPPVAIPANGPLPDLMTEEELVGYLRIPHVSSARNHHNVIENLKRMCDLPRIHICGKPLYPLKAVREWVERNTTDK